MVLVWCYGYLCSNFYCRPKISIRQIFFPCPLFHLISTHTSSAMTAPPPPWYHLAGQPGGRAAGGRGHPHRGEPPLCPPGGGGGRGRFAWSAGGPKAGRRPPTWKEPTGGGPAGRGWSAQPGRPLGRCEGGGGRWAGPRHWPRGRLQPPGQETLIRRAGKGTPASAPS